MRANDTPARLGGDEFAVLLDGIESPATAEEIAGRVVVALRYSDAEIGPRSVTVRASIGVAVARAGEASREELVRRADVAMYRAKGEGKGSIRHPRPRHGPSRRGTRRLRLTASAELCPGDRISS